MAVGAAHGAGHTAFARPLKVFVHAKEDMRAELGVEALGVLPVEALVGGVVDDLVFGQLSAVDDGAADAGGDAGEEVFDDAHRGEGGGGVVEGGDAREHGVEGAHLGPERAALDLLRG